MTLEKIKTLIRQSGMCVLATTGPDGPHTSLMAYICAPDVSELYLVTQKMSLKYRNIERDPRVSLLVDTREADMRGSIRAVTITGRAHENKDALQKDQLFGRIEQRHPHLRGLLAQPQLALISVSVHAFQLLDGVQDAHYFKVIT